MQRDVSPCGLLSFVWHPRALMRNIQSFWFSENFKSSIQSFPRSCLLGFGSRLTRMGPCLIHREHKWLQKEYLNMVIWEVPLAWFFCDAIWAQSRAPPRDVSRRASLLINHHISSVCSVKSRVFEIKEKKKIQIKVQTYLPLLIPFYVRTHLTPSHHLWNGNCSCSNEKPLWQAEQQ